jgi:UDP-N-acetylglucosamine 3-dehydrogenase
MRVGLVGAGFMGGVHLNAYAGVSDVEVVGVADARIESAVAGAEMVGARPYASYEDLVAAEDVEVVDVCLPTAFHRDLAVRAAGEGRHVILEKPIARTMEDARETVDAFSGDGPHLFVGHVVRFFPEYLGIKEKIDAGDLGMVGWSAPAAARPSCSAGTTGMPTGASAAVCLLDLVIHDFDYLRWTLGEVERIYARGMLGREYNRLDYVLATLRFESGTIAHVEGHWGYPGPFNYSIEVAGSNALLTVDSTEPDSLQLISGASEEVPDLASGKSPYAKELEHFIHCIATGEEPIVQSQDACEALRIGLAATESVLTGEPVTLGGWE